MEQSKTSGNERRMVGTLRLKTSIPARVRLRGSLLGVRAAWLAGGFVALGAWPSQGGEQYWIDEGVAFHAHESPGNYRVNLYRLRDPNRRNIHGFTTSEFLRNSLVDDDSVPEESGIFVLSQPLEGAKRLYQFKRKDEGKGPGKRDVRTILTVSKECRHDLLSRPGEFEEIDQECYVFPPEYKPPFESVSPVVTLRNPFNDERLYIVSKKEIEDILSVWEKRKDRVAQGVRVVLPHGKTLGDLVPVGKEARVGQLIWRFDRQQVLGKSVQEGDRSTKAKGIFVAVEMTITNRGDAAVDLEQPGLLKGGEGASIRPDKLATEIAVPADLRADTKKRIKPNETVKIRVIYDVPSPMTDITIETYGGDASDTEIILLDTGM